MRLDEAMSALEAAGSEQTRKTYARHGVGPNQFGVSFAVLKDLTKKIKVDSALAGELWGTGNHDARVLATMIADPKQETGERLDRWAADLDNKAIADALARHVARTPLARAKADAWSDHENEWIGETGWFLVTHLAGQDKTLPDQYFLDHLRTIERDIHNRKNRVRHAMNQTLISIGLRNPALEAEALAVAARIGKVEVDHGETACETPDVAEYIAKTKAYREKQAAKKKSA
jgi:3-methyladenine DNA glycosylase AlkD